MKRVFLIVLDSVGIGALPDAKAFGDEGAHTLLSCARTGRLEIPTLWKMGLGLIEGVSDKKLFSLKPSPTAAYGRMAERSLGKDTTTGHWELSGIILPEPFPTYPNGFPEEILREFSKETGRGILCNRPYSGTDVIRDYGTAHMETGDLIVYTSADSVFQIAAHEEVIPVSLLYQYCEAARALFQGKNGVGRVIARPFVGIDGSFIRTDRRKDFSLAPIAPTMLDAVTACKKDVLAIGKITDIFAGRGMTRSLEAHGNEEAMAQLDAAIQDDFDGLCFANLVDFDMKYGHRNDCEGYTKALNTFDAWLQVFLSQLKEDDCLIITADHGCDPGFPGTDHTREYVPILLYGSSVTPKSIGTRTTFCDVAKTVCRYLEVPFDTPGTAII